MKFFRDTEQADENEKNCINGIFSLVYLLMKMDPSAFTVKTPSSSVLSFMLRQSLTTLLSCPSEALDRNVPASASPSTRITGACEHTQIE